MRTFEIGLDGDVVDLVHRATPAATVVSVPTCTVLWDHIRSAEELDTLLDALLSMGITPDGLYESDSVGGRRTVSLDRESPPMGPHRQPAMSTRATYCEVRIAALLGDTILHSLRWSSRSVQLTVIRLHVSYETLRSTLAELSASTRIDYVVAV